MYIMTWCLCLIAHLSLVSRGREAQSTDERRTTLCSNRKETDATMFAPRRYSCLRTCGGVGCRRGGCVNGTSQGPHRAHRARTSDNMGRRGKGGEKDGEGARASIMPVTTQRVSQSPHKKTPALCKFDTCRLNQALGTNPSHPLVASSPSGRSKANTLRLVLERASATMDLCKRRVPRLDAGQALVTTAEGHRPGCGPNND